MPKHRTQLFLEPEQHEALDRKARREGRTISEVVREYVDQGLARSRTEIDRRLAALDELAQISVEIGPISGDPIAEVREERDREIEAVLTGRASE